MSEQTHQKLHLAKEHLDVAIELFLSGRSQASALVLAHAADDVLARILNARGIKPSADQAQPVVSAVEQLLRRQGLVWSKLIAEKQQAQQAALGAGGASSAAFNADLEDAALWMLVRAYDNYKRLGLQPSEKVQAFDQWLRQGLAEHSG